MIFHQSVDRSFDKFTGFYAEFFTNLGEDILVMVCYRSYKMYGHIFMPGIAAYLVFVE
jgi:hypothetical protein